MVRTLRRGDKLQGSLAATRSAVTCFVPWRTVIQWSALTLPFSWGYLIAGVSTKQTSVYPATGEGGGEIRPVPYGTRLRERTTHLISLPYVEHERTHADGRHRGRNRTAGVSNSLLSTVTGESDTARSSPAVGKTFSNLSSENASGFQGADVTEIEEEKAHPDGLLSGQMKHLSTRCNGISRHVDSSTDDQSRMAFSNISLKVPSTNLHLRNNNVSGRYNSMTVPTSRHSGEDGRKDARLRESAAHNGRRTEKIGDLRTSSFLHSGSQIVDELMATALGASSALLVPQAMGGVPNYSAAAQIQPMLSPMHSGLRMQLSPPPVHRAGGYEEVEIIFIGIGCVVAVLLILLLGLLLSGQRRWRV